MTTRVCQTLWAVRLFVGNVELILRRLSGTGWHLTDSLSTRFDGYRYKKDKNLSECIYLYYGPCQSEPILSSLLM